MADRANNRASERDRNCDEESRTICPNTNREVIWRCTLNGSGQERENGHVLDPCSWRRQRSTHRGLYFLSVTSHIKDLKNVHGQWTCFFCCHVQTATIIIGLWHMLLHLIALSLIAVVMINPEMLKEKTIQGTKNVQFYSGMQDVQAVNCTQSPCLLAAQGNGKGQNNGPDFHFSLNNLMNPHGLKPGDVNLAFFITLCTFVLTLLLVYGAAKGQPSHLMPFFFLQIFDFCISSMTMIGYISYLPNVKQMIKENESFPFQAELLAMDKKCFTFFIMFMFISLFLLKAYCINIVWRCYKYLMQRHKNLRWTGRSTLAPNDQEGQTLVVGTDLPDYDTAIADPQYRKKVFPEPPPTYDMAMAALQAQQHILDEISCERETEANRNSTQ